MLAPGPEQCPCQRAGGQQGGKEPERGRPAVEHELVDKGEGDLEIEPEGADDADEEDRDEQLPAVPHIGNALAEIAALAREAGDGEELARAHHEQGHQDCDVGRCVEQEARSQAHGEDQDPSNGRPDDSG